MSWAVEEWKDGLPGKALQRIQEMEVQLDKLKKERSQKQFQMDSLEAALQKQKQKVDSERNEISALKRENQSLLESCDSLEKGRQKVVHDLGVKEQQVNFLEGQLNACKKTIERLEQELKKYKNELDRSQPAGASSVASSEIPAFSTPQKCFATPAHMQTYRHQDNKLEDLQEKYNQEVQERKRLENELKILQVKMLNQSSVPASHKDIAARQQAGSSIFPWNQQEQIHNRHSQDAMETPLKRRGASLWELHDATPIKSSQRLSCAVTMPSPSGSSQQMDQLKTLNQELRLRVTELERNLANHEKDIKSQALKFQDLQTQLNQARKDLNERDKDLAKKGHELTQVTDKHQQVMAKCASVEQKLKQVTEEMNCQRHNAESCKRALEQKLKDLERDSQKELAQLQNTHQALERQMTLTQEIQQSKKDYNVLQSDMEKLNFQKSHLEKEVEEHKQKLLRSEQSLQACQTKEQDLHKKMEEIQREKKHLSVELDQSKSSMSQFEVELKKLLATVGHQTQEMGNIKRTLIESEASKNKPLQSVFLNLTQECEKVIDKIKVLDKDCQELKSSLVVQQNECSELKQANDALLQWKTEKESLINDTEAVQNGLKEQLNNSEKNINMLNEVNEELKKQLAEVQDQRSSLSAEIDSLKGELLNKCTELEEKDHQNKQLQSRLSEAGLKHSKDLENVGVQVAELETQVKDLQMRLQREVARAEQVQVQLQEEQQAASDLISSKEQLVELGRSEINQLRESLSLATAQQEEQAARGAKEKAVILKQCEESVSLKEGEIEQLKLRLEEAQHELLLAKNKITSVGQLLKVQEQFGEELQKQIKNLTETDEEHRKMLKEKTNEVEQIKQELRILQDQVEEKDKCLKDATDQIMSLERQKTELENSIHEMKILNNATTEKMNSLLEEMLALKEKVVEGKHAVDKLSVLEVELNRANQAHTEQKKNLEALEENLSSLTEIKSNLENIIVEKNGLISSLEVNIKEMTNKMETEKENHSSQIELFHNEERKLKDLIKEVEQREVANKMELRSRREEIKTMKATISAASSGLQERDTLIKTLQERLKTTEAEQNKTAELLKEKMDAMNKIKVQLEMLQMDLEDNETVMNSLDSQTEELKRTVESLEAQLVHSHSQASETEAKLEDSKAQVCVLETRLEEIQAQNTSLEAQYVTAREELMDRTFEITRLEEEAAGRRQLEDAVSDMQNELNKIRVENENLQTTLRQITECKDLLITEKNNLVNDIFQINIEAKDLKDSLNHLTEENTKLLRRLEQSDQLETKISELNSEINCLLNELQKVVQDRDMVVSKNNDLAQEKGQLEARISDVLVQRDDLQESVDGYISELIVLKDAKQCLEMTLTSSQQEVETLKEQLDRSCEITLLDEEAARRRQLEDNVAKVQTELNHIRAENEKLQSTLSQMTNDMSLLINKNKQLHDKTQEDGQLEKAVLSEKTALEADLHDGAQEKDLLAINGELSQSLASSEMEIAKLKEELDWKEKKYKEDLREKVSNFDVEQAGLHQVLAGLQTELAVFKEKYDLLQQQVKQQHDIIVQLSEPNTTEGPTAPCRSTECAEMDIKEICAEAIEEDGKTVPRPHFRHEMQQVYNVPLQECSLNTSDEEGSTEEPQLMKDSDALPKNSNDSHFIHENVKSTELPEKRCEFDDEADVKLQTLHGEIDLLNADLELRKEMSVEMDGYIKNLEKKMAGVEREAQEAMAKLNNALTENRSLVNQVGKLSEDNESLTLQLQTAKCQLTDIMEMLEGLEMSKGGWDEKFLQQESELKRVRSEKANLEQHILEMEGELETLQEEGTKLKQEIEAQRRACSGLENSMERLMAETTHLRSELVSCTEERDDLSQSLSQCKDQVKNLEKNNLDMRELISILEEDIRGRKKEYDILQSNVEKIKTEREQLLEQMKTLEQTLCQQSGEKEELMGQLEKIQEDHTSDINNTESMATKIQSLEGEVTRLTHSLESSLLEKGEIASRLNATQDEVQQMRTGIEKLQVRIEADERKKKKMAELLKDAQRKSDSLQDRIDALEREKEDMEQSLEEAVVQAESVKAELEEERKKVEDEKKELSEKLTELSTTLDNLKSEKENMEQELNIKKQEIEALKATKDELERGLEQLQSDRQQEVQFLERGMKEAAEQQTKEVVDLQMQLKDCQTSLLSFEQKNTELEADKKQMQSLLLECENEKKQLQVSLHSLQAEGQSLRAEQEELRQNQNTLIEVLENEIGELKNLLDTKKVEQVALEVTREQEEDQRRALVQSVTALTKEKEEMEERNRQIQVEKDLLQSSFASVKQEKEELQSALSLVKEENGNLHSSLSLMEKAKTDLEQSITLFKQDNTKVYQEKQTLEAEMQKCRSLICLLKEEKDVLNTTIFSLEEEKMRVEEEKEKLEEQKEMLQSLVSTKETELQTNKSSISELNNQVSELTSSVARLTKEKDSALSKINLWMKTCKQLEEEKQSMLNNGEKGKCSEGVSQLKMAVEEREKEIQNLKDTLKMKMNEAQQNDNKLEQLGNSLDAIKKELDLKNKELEEAKSDLIELNKLVEEKSQEADESIGKYCALMIEVHKLEETNSSLSAQLEQVTNKQTNNTEGLRRSSRKSSSKLHMTDTENIPSTPLRSPQGKAKRGRCDITDKDMAQEALHNLTKKIKATATNTPKSQAQDEDFRPEGLPELVQKGFADIPLGEASPFIMRRTTVRRCSPRLMSKQISTTSEAEKVQEVLHLQSPSADVAANNSNRKRLSQSEKVQKTSEAQGENCHVQ